MNFDDFIRAFNQAKSTIIMADNHVGSMARIISGRLRKANVPTHILCELKKELEKFNMHTKTWRD
jgi:hypothetical protein